MTAQKIINKNKLRSIKSLTHLTSEQIFHQCANNIMIYSYGYCFCKSNDFSGCTNHLGIKNYYYICRFDKHYSEDEIYDIKYNPIKLVNMQLKFLMI